jgi:hypothetical protein
MIADRNNEERRDRGLELRSFAIREVFGLRDRGFPPRFAVARYTAD